MKTQRDLDDAPTTTDGVPLSTDGVPLSTDVVSPITDDALPNTDDAPPAVDVALTSTVGVRLSMGGTLASGYGAHPGGWGARLSVEANDCLLRNSLQMLIAHHTPAHAEIRRVGLGETIRDTSATRQRATPDHPRLVGRVTKKNQTPARSRPERGTTKVPVFST